jgi:drug/metabolite transporter (DMT)-like permease
MSMILSGLGFLAGLGSLVCFVIVIVKMFQTGDSTLGIVCLVTFLCFGIGVLIAFIMGFVNQRKYQVLPVMLIWVACIVVGIACNVTVVLITQH